MKTLAKHHVCNHCLIGEKTFTNILIGPGKLPGLFRETGPRHNMTVAVKKADLYITYIPICLVIFTAESRKTWIFSFKSLISKSNAVSNVKLPLTSM